MSTRTILLCLLAIAASLSLAMCGGESPLSPSSAPMARVDDAPDVTGVVTSAANARGGVPKVTICHIPPGNPDNAHEITVGEPAVPAHLAHGDTMGACQAEEPPGVCGGDCSAFDLADPADAICCEEREDCGLGFDPIREDFACVAN